MRPALIIKRRGYQPGTRAAPYAAGLDPVEASRRIADAEAAARRAKEQPEEKETTE